MRKFLVLLALLLASIVPAHGQVAVSLMPVARQQFFDQNGHPMAGGCLFFWNAGTSTPAPTYADVSGTILQNNPVILDSSGYATIYLAAQSYKVALFSSGGTNCATGQQDWMQDNVSAFQILTQAQGLILFGTVVDPAGTAGQLGYRTDLGRVRFYNSAWDSIPGLNTTDAFTNKAIDISLNTLKNSSNTIGHYPRNNGTQYVDSAIQLADLPASIASRVIGIPFIIDGAGAVITTGTAGDLQIPFACTITGWTLLGDQVGSIAIEVKRSTYAAFPTTASIVGADPPTLATVQKNQNLAVTLWTTAINAGDILEFNVTSATTVTRVTVELTATIP